MSAKILIVDDERNVRLNYRITLETEGYEIFEAVSAANALDDMVGRSFDLAILDMRMPAMDGLQLLAKMREVAIMVPVMIVTAYSDVRHAVQAMKLGAIDFLGKPLRPEALRRIVTEILKRHDPQKIHPAESYHSHIAAAKRYLNLRSFAMARINLVKALQLNSKSVEGFNLTGVLAEMLEDFDKARKYYGQAIKLDRNYEPARQNMRRLSHCNTSARARNFSIWEEREGAV